MTPEQQAEELLKCTARCYVAAFPYSGVVSHSGDCPHLYRSAVAAALEAKDEQVRALVRQVESLASQLQVSGEVARRGSKQLAVKDAENNDLRSLDDLHRRHELVPNNEVGCSCPSCNLHNRYRTEIEQWKLVKEANDNGLKAIIAQLRSELAEIKMLVMWPTDDMEPPYRNLPHSDVIDRIKKIVAQAERKGIE